MRKGIPNLRDYVGLIISSNPFPLLGADYIGIPNLFDLVG